MARSAWTTCLYQPPKYRHRKQIALVPKYAVRMPPANGVAMIG
jgi:hypothetical protein